LGNQSQIGFPLFAEALELVESAVKSALETGFLAVEQDQSLLAPTCGASHLAGVIKFKVLSDVGEAFYLVGVEAGFLMVEASESPIRQG
jgi:hypothetical protein